MRISDWSSDVCSSDLERRYVVGAATYSQKHRGNRMTWTNDRVAELMRLWEAGRSASEIGRLLGVSKNSVVGKAHRMKLRARPSPIKRGSAPQVRRVAVATIQKPVVQAPAAPKAVETRAPAAPPGR